LKEPEQSNPTNPEMEDELRNALDGTTEEFSLEGKVLRAKVVSLYDADTCRVVFHLNNTLVKYTVRMVGIDTPEMRPSRSNPDRLKEKRAAKIARNRMAQFLTNAPIELMGSYTKSQFQDLIRRRCRNPKTPPFEWGKMPLIFSG
jgi:endonuclease YncB( thermonuclease family)